MIAEPNLLTPTVVSVYSYFMPFLPGLIALSVGILATKFIPRRYARYLPAAIAGAAGGNLAVVLMHGGPLSNAGVAVGLVLGYLLTPKPNPVIEAAIWIEKNAHNPASESDIHSIQSLAVSRNNVGTFMLKLQAIKETYGVVRIGHIIWLEQYVLGEISEEMPPSYALGE